MSFKSVFVFAQVLLIQSISAQCIGAYRNYDGLGYGGYGFNGLGYDGFACDAPLAAGAYGYGPASLAASHGPGLAVTSVSPLIPSGVSVLSENGYEGALAVGGAVPFLGTVALEGALPTIGAGAISYGCGDGIVTIIAEDGAEYGYAGIAEPIGYGYGLAGSLGYGYNGLAEPLGYGYDLARPFGYRSGCGYGAIL